MEGKKGPNLSWSEIIIVLWLTAITAFMAVSQLYKGMERRITQAELGVQQVVNWINQQQQPTVTEVKPPTK